MKGKLLFFFFLFLSPLCSAQADLPFIPESEMQRIIVGRRTTLYSFDQQNMERYRIKLAAADRIPYIVSLRDLKKKKVPKDCTMDVLGFARTEEKTDFDLYIVRDEEGLYYLEAASCPVQTLINGKNAAIREEYASLKEDLARIKEEFNQAMAGKLVEIKKDREDLEKWNAHFSAYVDSITTAGVAIKETVLKEQYDRWFEGLSSSAKKAVGILRIETSELGSPDSEGGFDYILWYQNMSSKTIKYLDWNGYVYNAVGDRVACTIRDKYLFAGRDTGPYGPGERGGGVWDVVIYNWSAKEMRLSSIRIQYMDGSIAIMSGADVVAVTGTPIAKLTDAERNKMREQVWNENRQDYLNRKHILDERESWAKHPEYPTNKVQDFFADEIALRREIMALEKVLAMYAQHNYIKE